MKQLVQFFVILAAIILPACVNENVVHQEEAGEIRTVTVIGPAPIQFEAITGDVSTKGTTVQDGSALLFGWAVGDTLGIFPNKGNQVEFPISVANGTTSASFDGGGWALRNNASYAAYYPFSVGNYHRDNETIILDYSGQVQDGNGSFAHLSAYDFLASNKTTPVNSSVTFQMERQGAILYIDIVVPEPETIKALKVSSDEEIFVEKAMLDISGSNPVVTPLSTTNSIMLSFKNTETTSDNETVRAYMAVQPLDFSDKTVTATLITESGSYTAPVTSRVVNKGRAAFLRFSDDFMPVNIEFADAEVKRICVENWDTNGDGELSYKEAAAVTDLGTVFRGNTVITTFNELEYFTGITEIANSAFRGCQNLESVVIPETVVAISIDAFMSCRKLDSVVLPDSLISIGSLAFCQTSIRSIHIPAGVISIGTNPFLYCDNLMSFSGNMASQDGHSLITNNGYLLSVAPVGLSEYYVPSGVTTIGNEALGIAHGITRIIIPEGVSMIGAQSIYGCDSVESIFLPNSLTLLGRGNFFMMSSLCSFSGKYASEDGRCLIGEDGSLMAFAPSGLTEYIVPEDVTSIWNDVFANTRSLQSIILPSTVTTIEQSAFSGSGITHIVLPSSLQSLGRSAFNNCNSLTEISIPADVESIGFMAFAHCSALLSITINSTSPCELGEMAFYNTANCPIYVPNESVATYKVAAGWSDYSERILGIDVNGSVVGPGPQNPD